MNKRVKDRSQEGLFAQKQPSHAVVCSEKTVVSRGSSLPNILKNVQLRVAVIKRVTTDSKGE